MRIVTNTKWFDGRVMNGAPVETRYLSRSAFSGGIRDFLRLRSWDAAVLNVAPHNVFAFCFLKRLFPSSRLRIVCVDLVLPPPRSVLERAKVRLVRWLLRAVDLFVFYCRDTARLRAIYDLPAEKIRYVPFKVNDYQKILTTPTSDAGYVLSCGRSYRDYVTLCQALEGLPYSARILVTPDELAGNGSELDLRSVPANVTVITDDGSSRSWREWIAHARLVVLPLSPDVLAPAGISTYLVAMALGKCVIISDSPATRGILEDGEQAMVVPPADPAALRAAVVKASEDADYRARIAQAGREYALSLRDEDRLADDIVHEVTKAISRERRQPGRLASLPES